METVRRYALLLSPRPAFLDWVNYVFPDDPIALGPPLDHDELDVFLIPNFWNIAEAFEWLEEHYAFFFDQQLVSWCEDETLWPQDRTWELFQDWLHISIQTCVYDVIEGRIEKEEI